MDLGTLRHCSLWEGRSGSPNVAGVGGGGILTVLLRSLAKKGKSSGEEQEFGEAVCN